MQRLPAGFLARVIEYRAYERAKAMVDAADTKEKRKCLPKSDMVDLATMIEHTEARRG